MKLRELKTSSGKLILAGKDAQTNEELIKQVQPEEDLFHTIQPGSPFVNIKAKKTTPKDRKEAAIFCAAKSQDWRDNKKDVEVHWFKGKDVFKTKGMKPGTFGGKKFKKILIKKSEIEKFSKEK